MLTVGVFRVFAYLLVLYSNIHKKANYRNSHQILEQVLAVGLAVSTIILTEHFYLSLENIENIYQEYNWSIVCNA